MEEKRIEIPVMEDEHGNKSIDVSTIARALKEEQSKDGKILEFPKPKAQVEVVKPETEEEYLESREYYVDKDSMDYKVRKFLSKLGFPIKNGTTISDRNRDKGQKK